MTDLAARRPIDLKMRATSRDLNRTANLVRSQFDAKHKILIEKHYLRNKMTFTTTSFYSRGNQVSFVFVDTLASFKGF